MIAVSQLYTVHSNSFSKYLPNALHSFGRSKQITIQSDEDLLFLTKELTAKKKYHAALHPYMALNRRQDDKYSLDVVNLLKKLKYKALHLIYLYKTQDYLKSASKPKTKFLEYICYLESYHNGQLGEFSKSIVIDKNDYIKTHLLLDNNSPEFLKTVYSKTLDPYQVYNWLQFKYFVPFNNLKNIKSLLKKFRKSSVFYPTALLMTNKHHPEVISKKRLISFEYLELQRYLKAKFLKTKIPLNHFSVVSPYTELTLSNKMDYSLWYKLYESRPYQNIALRILNKLNINSKQYKHLSALKMFSDNPSAQIAQYPNPIIQNEFQVSTNYIMYPKLQSKLKIYLSTIFKTLSDKNLVTKTTNIKFDSIDRDYIFDPFAHQIIVDQKLLVKWTRLEEVLLAGIFLQSSYATAISKEDVFKFKTLPHFLIYAYSYYLNPTFVEENMSTNVIFPMTYDSLLNFPYQTHTEVYWKTFRYQCYLLSKELRFNELTPKTFQEFIHFWMSNDLQSYIYKNKLE